MKIAIIPARGGSIRIKNKNIKSFNGTPILKKTLDKLNSYKIFDYIILSTDSVKIIKMAKKYNIDIIIKRNKNLANDSVSTNRVIMNAISYLNRTHNIQEKDLVFCVYPCAVFIKKKNILDAMQTLKKKNDFVFPVIPFTAPIEQALDLKGKNNLYYLNKSKSKKDTKKLKKKYYDAGQFYLSTKFGWKSKNKNLKGILLKKYEAVDIDDIEDWRFAQLIDKQINN